MSESVKGFARKGASPKDVTTRIGLIQAIPLRYVKSHTECCYIGVFDVNQRLNPAGLGSDNTFL